MLRQLQLQCAKCDAVMPHNQTVPNHVVHALVSVFMIGLWIPIWILISIGSDPAKCVKCGNSRKATGPATMVGAPVVPPFEKGLSTRGLLIMFAAIAVIVVLGVLFGSYLDG